MSRTVVGRFVHTTWINLNLRCGNGIYRLRGLLNSVTLDKSKSYEDINICFTRSEFRDWCWLHQNQIEELNRPSIDRIDRTKHYTLDNIQILELAYNIRKDHTKFSDGKGVCFGCKTEQPEENFCKDRRRLNGRANFCQACERQRGRRRYAAYTQK